MNSHLLLLSSHSTLSARLVCRNPLQYRPIGFYRTRPATPPLLSLLLQVPRTMSTTVAGRPKVEQPPWRPPPAATMRIAAPEAELKLYNSLTRSKTSFYPIDFAGKKVTWYCCGPTVYDAGHLGHARNYVTTDVLRRVLEGYFGFEVQFVQNVTDIDDKIILRARQSYLFGVFQKENPIIESKVLEEVNAAWQKYLTKNFADSPATPATFVDWAAASYPKLIAPDGSFITNEALEDLSGDDLEKEAKVKMHLKTLLNAAISLTSPASTPENFYASVKDILSPYLDSLHGAEVNDPKIFRETAAYWERHFNEDMATLNVKPPTVTTRVSEFVPENVAFVDKLVKKGFAYSTSDGSVYFDVQAYRGAGHHYAKLKPWDASSTSLLQDGEGALTSQDGKKNQGDFALWKSSKPGEPSWESPWGKGRPGWHIECSVMCSEVLGPNVDIHSGGIDLAFPHHDNEIAQSEAYWDPCTATESYTVDRHQWVNYFLHMGHLSIAGAKMSKSLKNFVSIREALSRGGGWTSRRLRVVFLLGSWKDGIEIREGVISEAKSFEATINKFFTNIKSLLAENLEKENNGENVPQYFGARERELYKQFDIYKHNFHLALCDSINTSAALAAILEVISKANIYLSSTTSKYTSVATLATIARWVTKQVHLFGLDNQPIPANGIGWSEDSADALTSGLVDKEAIAMPYVRALSTFRDSVRQIAMEEKLTPVGYTLLNLCDKVRDEDLPILGVSLDDRDSKAALVKFVSAEQLLAEKKEKEDKIAEKARKKEELRLERERAEREKLEKGKLSPFVMFKEGESSELWSEWDDEGIPVKDKDGEEVTKSKTKTLKKAWAQQKKAHDAYLAWVQSQGEADR